MTQHQLDLYLASKRLRDIIRRGEQSQEIVDRFLMAVDNFETELNKSSVDADLVV